MLWNNIMEYNILGFTVADLLETIILFVICYLAIKFILKAMKDLLQKSKLDENLHSFIMAAVKVALYIFAGLILASHLGINVTSLVALVSVVTLAISLSLQGILTNVASGIVLLITQPFKKGDFIETGDYSGTVDEISLIYTHVKTFDNKTIYIPNSDIQETRLTNVTQNETRMINLTISCSYDTPIQDAMASLHRAIDRLDKKLDDPAPVVHVIEYASSNINYTVRVWTKTEDYWDVYFALLEGVKGCLDEDGIDISYDQLNVHMIEK